VSTNGIFYAGPCNLKKPLQQAVSEGAIAYLVSVCDTYCGQSTHLCAESTATTTANIEETLVCYDQEAIHRYLATCFCAE
jgi:hypothetical protein